ncbi:hypothetical protein Q7Z20_10780, partial [Glaesserella parasuis]|nr:hypothetical protein [Glaesserella parasuis]
MKILYFTHDFSPENVKFAKEKGLILRNLAAYHATDFIEQCDAVFGDVPERYQHLPKHTLPEPSSQEKPLDKMTVPELTTALKALNVEIPQDTIRHNKFYFINVSKLNAVCFCKTA